MGSYDLAQIADLIGIYILDSLDRIKVHLYRDDSLIFIPESNGPKTSKIH